MAVFSYRGRGEKGQLKQGTIEASNANAAADLLIRQGVIPLEIRETHGKAKGQAFDLSALFQAQLPLEVLVIFCRQLYSLTKAGVPLLRAFKGLSQSASHPLLKTTLEALTLDLTNGRALSVAMQQHPRVFSRLFISMIHVGENTGRLDQVLLQLANYYEQEMNTRRQIKSAMRYPTFVLTAIVIAMGILNTKVIPQFASMFSRFGVELPWPTRVLIGTSNFFVHYWPMMIGVSVAIWLGIRFWRNTPKGAEKWDNWRLRMPITGSIVNRAQMARFARTFSLMIRAGVPLNQAIQMAAESLGNRFLENRLIEMKQGIEGGSSISRTATKSGVFTPLVLQMIAVGEETGQVDELLLEVADFYDREVEYDLKTLTARIEPIMLVVVAGMVLLLALGIFLPMWGMLDVAKGS
ncbi:type II secretion system F family protein [Photobacterium angustum]|uniref:type II secretion system F family protein n=1 Tax=Photobacterium angustum TaxID=661 RepID=UPI0005E036B0|nr:type II secretion system F family protein [Photobacterium angustum]KJF94351.1 MSHA biogenesis protein MshG [Photobacterium angustum]KJG01145.1 MSHA biogenesis protein MshG [Photobacterium angustum]KJG16652.1 MSHA biogenesis protein MshG [Photobacterium angustum]KJG22923.1 MSHA biogenesis protein MshG [Photobacterium angustum]KJG29891.1 MSHA biogenesis protein MshG [Photobacterium angustum]